MAEKTPNTELYTIREGKKGYTRYDKHPVTGAPVKVIVGPGDQFVPSNQELESFRDRLVPVAAKKGAINAGADDWVLIIPGGKKMEQEALKNTISQKLSEMFPGVKGRGKKEKEAKEAQGTSETGELGEPGDAGAE